jgi:hypothetical protein
VAETNTATALRVGFAHRRCAQPAINHAINGTLGACDAWYLAIGRATQFDT